MTWAEKGVRKEEYVLRWLRSTGEEVWSVFYFQEHGAGADIPVHGPEVSDQRSESSYPRTTAQPLHPLLLLHSGRGVGSDHHAGWSFFPFQATYWLNGHSFIEQELKRAHIGFRKNDNGFLAVDDVGALQAAADRLSPTVIRERLGYWTLVLGPKFSLKERQRMNLHRFYAIAQIEYCRNFIYNRHFPIHKILERSCELG